MCSLGHHQEGEDVKPTRARRRSDGSMTEAVAREPGDTLVKRREAKTAQLRSEMDGVEAAPMEPDQFQMQFEQLPPGVEQLPDHLTAEAIACDKRPYWVDMP